MTEDIIAVNLHSLTECLQYYPVTLNCLMKLSADLIDILNSYL